MKELEKKIVKFAKDRDWLQFNTPENLAKSIAIESGELLECFQWNNNYDKDELKYEIADVMNYCILLCHQIGVDPKKIVLEKMDISAKKYPIDKAKGRSTKYNKLQANKLYISVKKATRIQNMTHSLYHEWLDLLVTIDEYNKCIDLESNYIDDS